MSRSSNGQQQRRDSSHSTITMARRQHVTLTIALALVLFFSISYFFSGRTVSARDAAGLTTGATRPAPEKPLQDGHDAGSKSEFTVDLDEVPGSLLEGDSIAPKLENATLKAELGRTTWKFLHTMVARFPEKPTSDERKTLDTFFRLFGRLYPCGDCARHFRDLLAEYPPQTSSRNSAAGWLCFTHNMVNERLKKPVFDCTKIGDFYDCGCGDDKKGKDKAGHKEEGKREHGDGGDGADGVKGTEGTRT
ncbi:Sulfhydryl oxidase [Tolypocladium paradoxum]|uniref:Sulfhydryl oxidase n=1 Tax=Tolypocladium paradoxum TaxID=94208 RepID=A0A2S4KWF6_9HYPO|nr:Sulfhydryl oxidase [Tolypocladium paradoxum]